MRCDKYLAPERNAIDIIVNFYGEDPYLQECQKLATKRVFCYFDFHARVGQVTKVPCVQKTPSTELKAEVRRRVLIELIDSIWDDEVETREIIKNLARIYCTGKNGEMFYYLQAKRCLRVLTMGEVLKEPSAQVASIPLHSYIQKVVAALWEVHIQLKDCTDAYSTYTRINAVAMIREIAFKLYDSERPKLKTIAYEGIPLKFPVVGNLVRELHDLLLTDSQFVSAYLLMANLCKTSAEATENEALCYQKMLRSVPEHNKGHAFVCYRSAYFYEKKLMDTSKALDYYHKAIIANPQCYQALFKLGYYAAADGRFIEAAELLNQAIRVIFCGRSTEPDKNGTYRNWLSLSLKDSQYVYKAYMLLANIAINTSQEYAAKAFIGRACMAATRFDEATLIRHTSDENDPQFDMFMQYHHTSTPVWAIWQVLKPWSEDIIQDYFVRDIVRERLARWRV